MPCPFKKFEHFEKHVENRLLGKHQKWDNIIACTEGICCQDLILEDSMQFVKESLIEQFHLSTPMTLWYIIEGVSIHKCTNWSSQQQSAIQMSCK